MDTDRSAPDKRVRPNIEEEIDLAYSLDQQGKSLREIGKALGGAANATVLSRIKEGKKKHNAEYALELQSARLKLAANFNRWSSWLEDAHRLQDENAIRLARLAVGGGLLQIQREVAKLLGTDAARKLAVHIDEKPPEPTPNMETLKAFAESLDEYEKQKADIQESDGLGEFDQQ